MHTVLATITVKTQESGLRLDRLLNLRFPDFSRTHWQKMITEGQVLLENKKVSPSKRLISGQKIEYRYLQKEEPDVNTNFEIIHTDKDFLIVNKPANLPVHPSGVYRTKTLLSFLLKEFPDEELYLVNRLDRETSGLLLVGRNKKTTVKLQKQFRSSKVYKEYLVAVEGHFPQILKAQGYLFRSKKSTVWKKMIYTDDREKAEAPFLSCSTSFELIQHQAGLSLLKAVLGSGRTHQIRATLCSLSFPVVGDKIYGFDENYFIKFINDELTPEDRKKLRLDRSSLHSHRIIFSHPESGKEMKFTAALPECIQALFFT